MRIRRLPRCFVAAVPERLGRDALSGLQTQLREAWPERDDGWVDVDDLHLTVRFLGDLPAEPLQAALASLRLPEDEPALRLQCSGVELWPAIRPRIAVARFSADPRLGQWVQALEEWAVGHGLPPEHRVHAPHITLLRSAKPLAPVPASIAPSFMLRFTEVQAMHRRAAARGPRYEAHASYRLAVPDPGAD